MADNDNPTPAQLKKEKKLLALAFFYADVGEKVLKQLGEERSHELVFSQEVSDKISAYRNGELKYALRDRFMVEVVTPMMEAFLEKACPTVKGNPEMARWVCSQYLTHRHGGRPVKAEDLYKIGKNISFFNGRKTAPDFKEPKKHLRQYDTYAAFEQMLKPYLQAKAQKEAEAKDRHMDPLRRAQLMAETTVLYNGPEGQVFVPHTPPASELHGSNTKWCIAGRDEADVMFPYYNAQSPVIMLLPRGQPDNKVALVNHVLYDSTDETIDSLPPLHDALMQRCLDGLSEGVRKSMTLWLPENKPAMPVIEDPILADLPLLEAIEEADRKERLAEEARTGVGIGRPVNRDDPLWHNRAFVLAAIQHNAAIHLSGTHILEMAADEIRNDRDFLLMAIEADAFAFKFAPDEMKKDCDFIFAAVQRNSYALAHAPVKEDPAFVSRLLEEMDDLPFQIRLMKRADVWQPDDKTLMGYQVKALERMTERGDINKFKKYARHFKSTWGDPDTLFAADPAVTLVKIRAEVAAQYPAAGRGVAAVAMRRAM